jgi:hypothetical protein
MVLYPYTNPLSSLLCGDGASVSEMKLHMNSEISNLKFESSNTKKLQLPPRITA